jgi:hypothetical protein
MRIVLKRFCDDRPDWAEALGRSIGDVPQYQTAFQLRSSRDYGRDSGSVAPIRKKDLRIQQTFEGKRGRVPDGGR